MKKNVVLLGSIGIISFLLFLPCSHAIEHQLVEKEIKDSIQHCLSIGTDSVGSFFKKIWGLIEIITGISISIGITQLISLFLLPIILEIGLGPVVFLLVMTVLLTIPFQFLNGVCLSIQKQFSLGRIKTFLLSVFAFMAYFAGNFISMSLIPPV